VSEEVEVIGTIDQAQPKASEPDLRLIGPGEEVEVLWADDQDRPHLVRGKFMGVGLPTGAEGGPTKVIVETPTGQESVYTEDVVGMTPVKAES
jgi:hypothetical protein